MGQLSLPGGCDSSETAPRDPPGLWHAGCIRGVRMASDDPVLAAAEKALRRISPPRVADLMRREFVRAAPTESLLAVLRTMQLARLRHLLVVDEGRLVGLVSYRDLQDGALARAERLTPERWRAELGGVAVREAMRASPYFVRPETPADAAARRMLRLRLGCLPVCENGGAAPRLLRLLSESDLLRAAWK